MTYTRPGSAGPASSTAPAIAADAGLPDDWYEMTGEDFARIQVRRDELFVSLAPRKGVRFARLRFLLIIPCAALFDKSACVYRLFRAPYVCMYIVFFFNSSEHYLDFPVLYARQSEHQRWLKEQEAARQLKTQAMRENEMRKKAERIGGVRVRCGAQYANFFFFFFLDSI